MKVDNMNFMAKLPFAKVAFGLFGGAICGLMTVSMLMFCGCEKQTPEAEKVATPEVDKYDTPKSRMDDPIYVQAITEQNVKRDAIAERLAKAREEFRAAKAKGDAELTLVKSNALMAVCEEFEANRQETIKLVRARILREQQAIKAKAAREGEKSAADKKEEK